MLVITTLLKNTRSNKVKYYSQSNKTKKKKERGERKRKRNSKGKSIKLQSLLLTLLFLVIASEGTEHFLADNYVEQRDRNHYLKSVSSFSLPRCPVLNAMSLQIILPILFFNSIVCTFSFFLPLSHGLSFSLKRARNRMLSRIDHVVCN